MSPLRGQPEPEGQELLVWGKERSGEQSNGMGVVTTFCGAQRTHPPRKPLWSLEPLCYSLVALQTRKPWFVLGLGGAPGTVWALALQRGGGWLWSERRVTAQSVPFACHLEKFHLV